MGCVRENEIGWSACRCRAPPSKWPPRMGRSGATAFHIEGVVARAAGQMQFLDTSELNTEIAGCRTKGADIIIEGDRLGLAAGANQECNLSRCRRLQRSVPPIAFPGVNNVSSPASPEMTSPWSVPRRNSPTGLPVIVAMALCSRAAIDSQIPRIQKVLSYRPRVLPEAVIAKTRDISIGCWQAGCGSRRRR